ncbi:MAG: hypothetical protein AAGF23_11165 [Acidobacteriota bacterium]
MVWVPRRKWVLVSLDGACPFAELLMRRRLPYRGIDEENIPHCGKAVKGFLTQCGENRRRGP